MASQNHPKTMHVEDILSLLPSDRKCLIVFDVDCTLSNGTGEPFAFDFEARPGGVETVQALVKAGHEVRLWTAGGKKHAEFAARTLEIEDIISGTHGKTEFPPQEDDVIRLLGRLPDLTVDDDRGEGINGVPILVVEAFWGKFAD